LVEKNEIVIITARPARWKEKTDAWVKKYLKIPFKIFYSSDFHKESNKTKAQLCHELGVNVMIEDVEDCAIGCANLNIKVILFDRPWNKKVKHKNIIRVKNWKEAIQEINKINK
jgi:uncharacterized HAD superfamily protein